MASKLLNMKSSSKGVIVPGHGDQLLNNLARLYRDKVLYDITLEAGADGTKCVFCPFCLYNFILLGPKRFAIHFNACTTIFIALIYSPIFFFLQNFGPSKHFGVIE